MRVEQRRVQRSRILHLAVGRLLRQANGLQVVLHRQPQVACRSVGGHLAQLHVGAGGVFVASVKGSVSNVVGLPLTTVVSLARQLGVDLVG